MALWYAIAPSEVLQSPLPSKPVAAVALVAFLDSGRAVVRLERAQRSATVPTGLSLRLFGTTFHRGVTTYRLPQYKRQMRSPASETVPTSSGAPSGSARSGQISRPPPRLLSPCGSPPEVHLARACAPQRLKPPCRNRPCATPIAASDVL
jgi:hypothetical protein